MCDLVDEAMGAGALGFSTSRTLLHRVPDGRPVPGTWADERELLAIADVLGRRGHGVYEVAPRFERPGPNYEGTRAEVHWMAEINRRTGRPVTFGLAQSNAGPELFRKILELVDEEGDRRRRAAAADHRPRHRAPVRHAAPHVLRPCAGVGRAAAAAARRAPRSACATAAAESSSSRAAEAGNTPPLDWQGVYVLTPTASTIRPTRRRSLAAQAERHGETIAEAFVRISLETDGRALFNYPFLNQRMDAVEELLDHPRMAIGLGDSGAHVGLIMDASLPTWFLLHWVRDRGQFTIEDAVRRMTSDTAALFGIADRGVLRVGAFADVNVLDLDALALQPARVRARLSRRRGPLRATRRRIPRDDRQRRALRRSTASPPARTRAAPCGPSGPQGPTGTRRSDNAEMPESGRFRPLPSVADPRSIPRCAGWGRPN